MSLINSCVHPISSLLMEVSSSIIYHSVSPGADLTRTINLVSSRTFTRPPCCDPQPDEISLQLCETFQGSAGCVAKPGPGAMFYPPLGLFEFEGGTVTQTCSGASCPPPPGFTDIRSVFSVTGGCYFASSGGIITIDPVDLFWTGLLPNRSYGIYFFNLPYLTCDGIDCTDPVPDCTYDFDVNPAASWALDVRAYGNAGVMLVELPSIPTTAGVAWARTCSYTEPGVSITSVEQHNISLVFSQDGTWITS
jgi:hypothetical protein